MNIEINEKIPFSGSYDIIVAGGGVAGAAAALAAAREGKRVVLLEKSTMLGGLATLGLINYFVPMCNGRGVQIIKGMAEEFLRLSIKYGYDTLPSEWVSGQPDRPTLVRYATRYSAPVFALALTELLNSAGVEILFDAVVSSPVMNGSECRGLIVESKSGRGFYEAKIIIDTTGDADILYRAGVPTIQGENFHTYVAHGANLSSCKAAYESGDITALQVGFSGGNASLYGSNHPDGIKTYSGTDINDINRYFITNQLECLDKIKDDNRYSRDIIMLPGMAQFRTTRHIDGDYTLRTDDAYRHFNDSVGAICDFDRRDYLYEIPYGTMIRSGFPNLITAGRTASAEGYAWDVLRVIPPAIISGQAAGIASSLSIESGIGIDRIDISMLQSKLEANGVLIHFDDSLIPEVLVNEIAEDNGHF